MSDCFAQHYVCEIFPYHCCCMEFIGRLYYKFHSILDRHLSSFRVWVIVNSVVMTMLVYVFGLICVCVFVGQIPGSGIVGSDYSYIPLSTFLLGVYEFSCSTSSPPFVFFIVYCCCILWFWVVFPWWLVKFSFFFIWLLAIWLSSFTGCLLGCLFLTDL